MCELWRAPHSSKLGKVLKNPVTIKKNFEGDIHSTKEFPDIANTQGNVKKTSFESDNVVTSARLRGGENFVICPIRERKRTNKILGKIII